VADLPVEDSHLLQEVKEVGPVVQVPQAGGGLLRKERQLKENPARRVKRARQKEVTRADPDGLHTCCGLHAGGKKSLAKMRVLPSLK